MLAGKGRAVASPHARHVAVRPAQVGHLAWPTGADRCCNGETGRGPKAPQALGSRLPSLIRPTPGISANRILARLALSTHLPRPSPVQATHSCSCLVASPSLTASRRPWQTLLRLHKAVPWSNKTSASLLPPLHNCHSYWRLRPGKRIQEHCGIFQVSTADSVQLQKYGPKPAMAAAGWPTLYKTGRA